MPMLTLGSVELITERKAINTQRLRDQSLEDGTFFILFL